MAAKLNKNILNKKATKALVECQTQPDQYYYLNKFYLYVEDHMSPEQQAAWEDFCLKATAEESIYEALRVLTA